MLVKYSLEKVVVFMKMKESTEAVLAQQGPTAWQVPPLGALSHVLSRAGMGWWLGPHRPEDYRAHP